MSTFEDEAVVAAFAGRPLTSGERKVLLDVRDFMERGGYAVNRRSPGFAVEVLIGGAMAALLVTFIVLLARHAASVPKPVATPTSVISPSLRPTAVASPPPPATPLVSIPLNTNLGAPRTFSVALGDVWMTTTNAGQPYPETGSLVRFDATTGRRLSTWTVGGDPLGIAVSSGSAWVANGSGDHKSPLADTDTVLQLDAASGSVLRKYPVTQPMSIVAQSGVAWVLAGGTGDVPTEVVRLEGGTKISLGALPLSLTLTSGTYSNLEICGGSAMFAVSGTQTLVFAFPLQGGPYHQVAAIPASGVLTLACNADALIVAVDNADDGGLFHVGLSDGAVTGPFGERFPTRVAYINGRFIVSVNVFDPGNEVVGRPHPPHSVPGYLEVLDPASGEPGSTQTTLSVGGDQTVIGGDASGVWVEASLSFPELVKVRPT